MSPKCGTNSTLLLYDIATAYTRDGAKLASPESSPSLVHGFTLAHQKLLLRSVHGQGLHRHFTVMGSEDLPTWMTWIIP